MPYADHARQIEYQRQWMQRRRQAWIAANGPCAQCGSSNRLEVDHIEPEEKTMNPTEVWSLTKAKREAELKKCQVLCHDCHQKKSMEVWRECGRRTSALYPLPRRNKIGQFVTA